MRIFISSVIVGMKGLRDAAEDAARLLGHEVVRGEDFGASPETPQQTCLAGVRRSDAVILLLGAQYGVRQPSGFSATEEEYREARERGPVLVFVQEGTAREVAQETFLQEVRGWTSGHYTTTFGTPEELRTMVVQALHSLELSRAVGPIDETEMLDRARQLVPATRGIGQEILCVIIVGGPPQQVLRPVELEDPVLVRDLSREALFGEIPILDVGSGTRPRVEGDALVIVQDRASVLVNEQGSIRIIQSPRIDRDYTTLGLPSLIEEDVQECLVRAIRFGGWILDRVDPVRRISDVVLLAVLVGGTHLPWRTRSEYAAEPGRATLGHARTEVVQVLLSPARRHRAALLHETVRLAEDLTIRLRRDIRG